MKYSVIIPHYNSGELLCRLLNSIPLRNDVEVIVVDDKSTDNSFEKVCNNKNYQHVIFCSAVEKGYAGGARNLGMSIASGDYFVFADSDDYFTCNAFEIFDSTVNQQDLILFDMESFIEGTDDKGDRHLYRAHKLNLDKKNAALGAVGPVAKLVRRELVKQHDIYFSKVVAANDVVFSIKTACFAKNIDIVRECVYMVSQSDSSLTGGISLEKSLSRINEQFKRIALVRRHKPVSVYKYCLLNSLLFTFERFSKELESKEYDEKLYEYKRYLGLHVTLPLRFVVKVPFGVKRLYSLLNMNLVVMNYFRSKTNKIAEYLKR